MKKPSVVSFLITLLLAAAVCTQGQEPVMDIDNKPVEIKTKYFILPISGANVKEGLLPLPIRSKPLCPFGISQGIIQQNPGVPISFDFPFETNETIVQTFYDVTIDFKSGDMLSCEKFSKFWVFSETLSSEPPILVAGNPKKENSWFQVMEGGANIYKLTTFAGTVGTTPSSSFNGRELVLTNDNAKTLLVKFMKVPSPPSTSTSHVEKFGLRMFPFY